MTHALCARPLNHFARQREFGPELRTICRRLTHAEGMISIARPAQCGRPTFRAEHAGPLGPAGHAFVRPRTGRVEPTDGRHRPKHDRQGSWRAGESR